MDLQSYINNQIPKFIDTNKFVNHYQQYNIMRIKRFLLHTTLIFICQFLIIVNLTFGYPILPMYPPIGVAFVMFHLFGMNAFAGLLLSELLGYVIYNIPINIILLYCLADLFSGWLSSYICKNISFLDVTILVNKNTLLEFIKKNAVIILLFSAPIKLLTMTMLYPSWEIETLLYNYINFWISDLNAILIIPSCILSWLYVLFNRHHVSTKPIKLPFIISLIMFIVLSVLFIKQLSLIGLIIIGMFASIYYAYYHGYLISTLLLFIVSAVYLTYFIDFKNQYLLYFGTSLYTLISVILFLFSIGMLYTGLVARKMR